MRTSAGYSRAAAAAFAISILGLAVAVQASEYNFSEQSGKTGCASIITEGGQKTCADEQKMKDEACKVSVDCDFDKQEKTIQKYKEAKDKLERGQVNDADKDKLKETIRALKDELDARKEGARKGAPLAEACVTAR